MSARRVASVRGYSHVMGRCVFLRPRGEVVSATRGDVFLRPRREVVSATRGGNEATGDERR